jgi:hypothetical protein
LELWFEHVDEEVTGKRGAGDIEVHQLAAGETRRISDDVAQVICGQGRGIYRIAVQRQLLNTTGNWG